MIRNYLKTALRNLWLNKKFSLINISGLAIGIAGCLLIMLFVTDELSHDRFHEKAERIVRVVFRGSVQGELMNEAHVMPPVAQALQNDYPEVLQATRLRVYGRPRISYGPKTFHDNSFAFADSNLFQVFTLPLLKGDAATVLSEPNSLVISEAAALQYFGSEDPVGKLLRLEDFKQELRVSGVMKNIPSNSHFQFDLLASMATLPEARADSWMTSEFYTYLVLPEGYDYKKLEAKLPQVAEKYMGPQLKQAMGISLAEFQEAGNSIGLYLEPLRDIYLHSDARGVLQPGGDIRYVYIFGAIALFMLLIACINYMNLATAASSNRAREVGVRKVLGSGKGALVGQFLMESILLTIPAMLLALALVKLALPFFNDLAGKQLLFSLSAPAWTLPVLLFLSIVVGMLAGAYPAFFLSSFNTIAVLKGARVLSSSGDSSMRLRSGLVVFQFMISIALIIGTIVVYQQLQFIQDKDLGYDNTQVLVLPEAGLLGENKEAFRQQLLQHPQVLRVSTSGYLPAGPSFNNNFFVYPNGDVSQQIKTLRYDVDEDYIPALGIQMLEGRNFSSEYGADSAAIVLNETAARVLGWGAEAIGQTLTTSNNQGERSSFQVIGIVKDFHFRSLHERISPLVMVLGRGSGSVIVKAQSTEMADLLAGIQSEWTKFSPGEPFAYSFLDERHQQAYEAERKVGIILGIFAGLTIFVACLGLFGLALFTAGRRSKEIGIRKVLGASEKNIVMLLSGDFIKLVLIAFIIATPIAWYFMHQWLQNFAYRIEIRGWFFLIAALLALIIAVATVSYQAISAASANPVKNLRTE